MPHLLRANAINVDSKRNSGITGFSFWREAKAVLLAAVILRDDVLYRYPFALESAEGDLVAVETCCPAGQGIFLSRVSGGSVSDMGWP